MEKINRKQNKFVEVNVEKYKSFDGKEFNTENDCKKHEEHIRNLQEIDKKYQSTTVIGNLNIIGSNIIRQYTIKINEKIKYSELLQDLSNVNDTNFFDDRYYKNDISIETEMKQEYVPEGKYLLVVSYIKDRNPYGEDYSHYETEIYSIDYLLKQVDKLKKKIEKL